jgi:hypothetical protein
VSVVPAPVSTAAPLTRRRLDEAHRALFDRQARVVGWGSGSVFDYFHQHFPVRLDYLVDNDASRWGTTRHGLPIVPPARLVEDADTATLVVIYSSAWPEIQRQLAALGPISSLPASAVFADGTTRATLGIADGLAATAPRREPADRSRAIVVQGPVLPYTTPYVVRAMSARHPSASIILSTWDDTAELDLAAVRPWVDDVVLSPRPDTPGIQNRNLQIASSAAGIARAREAGATMVLKTRTDLAVLAPHLFDQAAWWTASVGRDAARRAGLRDRLIVPSCYTRKYLLYHPSDLVMLGHVEDLAAFWQAPLDARSGSLLAPEWLDRPLGAVNLAGNPTESYLGLAFCASLGRPVRGTLDDSWAFYRDLFAVVDNHWFDLLWCKNLAIPDAALRSGLRETVSQSFWQRLQFDERVSSGDADAVDPFARPLRALSEAA